MKVVAFEIVLNGVATVLKNQEDLRKAIKDTKTVIDRTDFGTAKYKELEQQLGTLTNIQKQTRKEAKLTAKEQELAALKAGRSYRALEAQAIVLKNKFKELSREQRNSIEGKELAKQVRLISSELKDLDKEIGDNFRNVGNYADSLKPLFSNLQNLIAGGFAALAGFNAINLGIDGITEGAVAIAELSSEFISLRGEVKNLTGSTGDDLDNFTQQVIAIATTFDKDVDEVLLATNSLTKQLTGDFQQSLELVETGFLSGSDASGQLLDNLREYPTFFKDAQLTGEQLIATIAQSNKEGIFSDKGVDSIKEFALRIRELPKSTETALAAIGISAKDVGEAINEKGIGGALTLVQSKLQNFEDDSKEVGQVLADVFGSAGEDSGIGFVKNLDLVNTATSDLIDTSNSYVTQQQRLLAANNRFAQAQADLANQVGDLSKDFTILGKEALALVLQSVVKFFEIIKAIPAFIQNNRFELAGLAGALLTMNAATIASTTALITNRAAMIASAASAKGMAVAQRILNVAMSANPIGLFIAALGFLIGGLNKAYNSSQQFRGSIAGLASVAKEVFTIVKEAVGSFIQGFDQIRQGNIKQGFKLIGKSIIDSNPIKIAFTEGDRLKKAYLNGYNDKVSSETKKASKEQQKAILEGLSETGNATAKTAKETGKKIGGSLVDGIKETTAQAKKQLRELQSTQQQILASIANNESAGKPIENLTNRLKTTTEKIKLIQAELATSLKGNAALTELARKENAAFAKVVDQDLSQSLDKLEQQLNSENNAAWKEYSEQIDLAQKKQREFVEESKKFANETFGIELEGTFNQPETKAAKEEDKVLDTIDDEQTRSALITEIQIEKEKALLEQQLGLFEINSSQYLELQNQIAQQDIALVEAREAAKQAAIQRTFETTRNATNSIIELVFEEGKAREVAAKVNEKITALEILLSQKRIIQTNLETLANNLKAVSEGAKIPFPANLIAIGSIIGAIATSITQVKKLSKFEDGGLTKGRSHSQGGIPIEVEGGEYIIRKSVISSNEPVNVPVGTPLQIASYLNERRAKRPKFAEGGITSTGTANKTFSTPAFSSINSTSRPSKTNVVLSPDQIQNLANTVALQVKEGAREGIQEGTSNLGEMVEKGTEKGINSATEKQLRQERLNRNLSN